MTYATSAKQAKEWGHQFYYTGKVCKRGHVDWRRTSCGMCVKCEYEKNAEYRANNREHVRQYGREWARKDYAKDPTKQKEAAKKAYYNNKEQSRENNRKWRRANSEYVNAKRRERMAENPELVEKNRERANRWAQENHDQVIQRNRNRRAREREAEGTHTVADVRRLYDFQNGRCAACSEKLDDYHVDHVIPLAAGGSNYPENLQILCPTCNSSKGAKDPIEWARQNRKLF